MTHSRTPWRCVLLLALGAWLSGAPAEARVHSPANDGDDSRRGDVVSLGHDATLEAGQSAGSVVSILGSSSSAGDAEDVVSVFGTTTATGTVHDSAVAVFGNTYVDAKVEGDAVSVFGNVELGPHADVDGDVVSVLGTVRRDPAAVVHGGVQSVFPGTLGHFEWLRVWIRECLLYGRPLAPVSGLGWAWSMALAFLGLYVLLALLFRSAVSRCAQTFETHAGLSLLAGLLGALAVPVIVVLLCVTVIGIAAIPFVTAFLLCVGLFGKAVMLAWLGGRITSGAAASGTANPVLASPAAAVLIGGVVITLLYLVPVLGFLTYNLLGFLGFGAVVYTLVLLMRSRQAAKANAGPPPVGAEPPRPPVQPTAAPAFTTGATDRAAAAPFAADAAPVNAFDSGHAPTTDVPPGAGPSPAAGASVPPPPPPREAHAHSAVSAASPRAGFWIRMAALFLDVLLIGFGMSVLSHGFHLQLIVLAIYGAVMWKLRGATVGGIVFDLHVVRLDGRQVDWETAIVRALSCFLSLAVIGLGFIWIALDPGSQAWHDKIAGTVVVRVPKAAP